MTDKEKMEKALADDLTGVNGDGRRADALMDVFRLQLNSAMATMMIKGGGDVGCKALGNDIVISDL